MWLRSHFQAKSSCLLQLWALVTYECVLSTIFSRTVQFLCTLLLFKMYLSLSYMLHACYFIGRLAKQAKCARYIHSPKALAVSATFFQALFFFVMSLHIPREVITDKNGHWLYRKLKVCSRILPFYRNEAKILLPCQIWRQNVHSRDDVAQLLGLSPSPELMIRQMWSHLKCSLLHLCRGLK